MPRVEATETTVLIGAETVTQVDHIGKIDQKQTEEFNGNLKQSLGILVEISARLGVSGIGCFIGVLLILMMPDILKLVLPRFIHDEDLRQFFDKLLFVIQVVLTGASAKVFQNSAKTVERSNCAVYNSHMPFAVTAASECAQELTKENAKLRAKVTKLEVCSGSSSLHARPELDV
ncbi:MAG: hypothetical protein KBD64_01785 [Gammaproteobacteria bacterium]|nr:hypothetical protein [Gammaproteobacteria bacterium]